MPMDSANNDDIDMFSDDMMMVDMPEEMRRGSSSATEASDSTHPLRENNDRDSSNNLRFMPYSNNTLTRSTATLNLSLTRSSTLQNITEEYHGNDNTAASDTDIVTDVNASITRWSPFHTSNHRIPPRQTPTSRTINAGVNSQKFPTSRHGSAANPPPENQHSTTSIHRYPVTRHSSVANLMTESDNAPTTPVMQLKRTASKSGISPDVKHTRHGLSAQMPMTSQPSEYSLLKHAAMAQVDKENQHMAAPQPPSINITQDLPMTMAPLAPNFNPVGGLKSKVAQLKSRTSKEMTTPDTPVKRYPLRENTQLTNLSSSIQASSILEDSEFSTNLPHETNITNEYTGYQTAQIAGTPKIHVSSVEESSPLSAMRNSVYSQSRRNSPFNDPNKYKKLKKSRDSVIMKNIELTNSLQQFTDDLYGTGEEDQTPFNNTDLSMNSARSKSNNLSFFGQEEKSPREPSVMDDSFGFSRQSHISVGNNIPHQEGNDDDDDDDMMGGFSTPTKAKTIVGAKPRVLINNRTWNDNSSWNEMGSPSDINRSYASDISANENADDHLFEKFSNVTLLDEGHFSKVYQVTFAETQKKYAVKAISLNKRNSTGRILQEINLLAEIRDKSQDDAEGKEYVVDFVTSWKYQSSFYVMSDYYENGNLDKFLNEQIIAKNKRLDEWRIWKIIVELSLALRFIHDTCHIAHLDLKPANVMITFEGTLKLVDFGMATHLPLENQAFENEGDREYIAPEIISDSIYDFRADIFSLGLMVVEIATNVILPDNGNAWHKLRSGDLSDAGRLSSTDIHSESLFSTSTKFDTNITDLSNFNITSATNGETTTNNNLSLNSIKDGKRYKSSNHKYQELLSPKIPAWVPKFLIDGESLERTVKWMIDPDYNKRPTADELLHTEECMYVEMTRLTGAVIQEDDYGPRPKFFM
ncbi:tyrosine protein kinase [Maudiozyma humilis]|uniref:Tyrosine protein kinase n=1 Tax=Maudiozyma humilis TaxID=51915 RepID=A0AAV5RV15_MAUHU|nr:tyrosine protein kinase [Kazachstania humilis]